VCVCVDVRAPIHVRQSSMIGLILHQLQVDLRTIRWNDSSISLNKVSYGH
jgi:hypothetical protein